MRDWRLRIAHPNPQSPIPNPQPPIPSREGAMLQKLTVVAPRDNDALTLRRGHALAQVLMLLMVIGVGLAALSLNDRDRPAQITTAVGMTVFVLVYAINRTGRVRLAMVILLIGGT